MRTSKFSLLSSWRYIQVKLLYPNFARHAAAGSCNYPVVILYGITSDRELGLAMDWLSCHLYLAQAGIADVRYSGGEGSCSMSVVENLTKIKLWVSDCWCCLNIDCLLEPHLMLPITISCSWISVADVVFVPCAHVGRVETWTVTQNSYNYVSTKALYLLQGCPAVVLEVWKSQSEPS